MIKPNHILLVDDDEDDQFLFTDALAEIDRSIRLEIAFNGLDALAALHKAAVLPDVIFMDIYMPLMNGLDCLRRLKAIERLKNIPVVVLSATKGVIQQQMAASGAILLLTKPFLYPELKHHITEGLAGNLLYGQVAGI